MPGKPARVVPTTTAAVLAVACAAASAQAAALYSFETLYNNPGAGMGPPQPEPLGTGPWTRPDGFFHNPAGPVAVQDTIGATDGTKSLRFSQAGGQTFSAALTGVLDPIGTINHVNTFGLTIDVTIPATGNFTGGFARMGIMEFGDNTRMMGAQAQSMGIAEQNVELVPGTYRLLLPLFAQVNPADPEFDEFDVPFSEIFGPDDTQQLTTPTGFQFFFNKSGDQPFTAYLDNVQAVPVGAAAQWAKGDSSSVWSDPTSWLGGVPSGAGVLVSFGASAGSNEIVTVDSARTVGQIDFNNGNAYTLSGSAITLDTAGGDSAVNVYSGPHVIAAPLVLNKNTTFRVASQGGSLTLASLTATGRNVTKTGLGTLLANRFRGNALAVNGGIVRFAPAADLAQAGALDNVSRATTVAVAGGAQLDLTNTKLIVSAPVGTWTGAAYDGVSGLVDAGRGDAGNALWNGTGIITSDTRAIATGDLASIGVARVSDVRAVAPAATTTFAGQTVLGSDTVVMFTWGGDANLDGKINIDDYGQIDSNVAKSGTVFGWSRGDFNYDGKINIDDYGIIDGNIGRQGPAILVSGGVSDLGVTAVPEPSSLLALGAAAALGVGRRRRGRSNV